MTHDSVDRPDLTLTLDRDGVIKSVESSAAFADESIAGWAGRSWRDTMPVELGARVSEAVESSTRTGEPSRFRMQHRLPNGKELPVEFTTVSLGENAGFVAIGRSLQTVSDLQSRLVDAQRAREQDYWKLREIETRYRAVLDATSDAVALVRTTTLRVVESNLAAARVLGLVPGSEFFPDLSTRDRNALETALQRTRAHGRAPNIALHLPDGVQWSLRASLVSSETDSFYLCQMSHFGDAVPVQVDPAPLDSILQRFPDALAVVDSAGVVVKANLTFLDFVQMGVESAVIGQKLDRWLSQPGADGSEILSLVRRHGSVRMLRSRLEGELGSMIEVEVSAVGDRTSSPLFIGLTLRDAGSREAKPVRPEAVLPAESGSAMHLPGNTLEEIVRTSVEAIERRCIEDALIQSRGNRTAAARYLGLSRQTLHLKLNRYQLESL